MEAEELKKRLKRALEREFGANSIHAELGGMIIGGSDTEEEEYDSADIIKSWPAKEEWIAKFSQMTAKGKKMQKDMNRLVVEKKALWAEIELSLEVYGEHLHVNTKSKEIEQIGNKKDKKKLIKSPIQSI